MKVLISFAWPLPTQRPCQRKMERHGRGSGEPIAVKPVAARYAHTHASAGDAFEALLWGPLWLAALGAIAISLWQIL